MGVVAANANASANALCERTLAVYIMFIEVKCNSTLSEFFAFAFCRSSQNLYVFWTEIENGKVLFMLFT